MSVSMSQSSLLADFDKTQYAMEDSEADESGTNPSASSSEDETEREIVYIQENSVSDNDPDQDNLNENDEESLTDTSITDELDAKLNKQQLCERLAHRNVQLQHKVRTMSIKLRDLQREVVDVSVRLEKKFESNQKLLKAVFNDDQIKCLNLKASGKFESWSEVTVKKALRLKRLCGIKGYKELLKQNYPLPSLETLRKIGVKEADYSD